MNFSNKVKFSSQQLNIQASKTVYVSQKEPINNIVKHGSGGNSYQNYLSRKKGIIFSKCC
jgi:hypothetical protein